ncbi:MAG: EAL domain-containing protein [Clostridiales bacterium]|nr:EAL domain-containing protein [Clostridiales bacterium]
MRILLAAVLFVFITALVVCMILSLRSKKSIGRYVACLISGVIPPIVGNLILMLSTNHTISMLGFYIYFLGMDATVYSLLRFSYAYCEIKPPKWLKRIPDILIISDVFLYALNPILHVSFSAKKIMVDAHAYYKLVPYAGQTYHRVIAYGIFLAVVIVFLTKAIKTPKIYSEKYWVILFSSVVAGALETYYIFSKITLDISMLAFGIFGILVYYFALHYRPMKLLDKMLSGIASDMPDALYFFDTSGKCIWMNEPGRLLIGTLPNDYDGVRDNLTFLFGNIDFESGGWSKKQTLGTGDEAQYTNLLMRTLTDDDGKATGTYLSIRDVTDEQNEMKREMYNSTHDSLTGFYTKEYLYEAIEKRLRSDTDTDYMIGYMEISNFKVINDVFGKRFGELTIKKAAEFIMEGVSSKCLYGRLSEDAFGILIDKEDFNSKPVDEKISGFTVSDKDLEHHVLIHYGIYDITEGEEIDVPLFFDSARLATAKIADSYQTLIVYYDDKIRNEIIHEQLISNQLHEAIETNQIRPFLQPIVDGKGILVGAEALVRWVHPDDGLKPPGTFIPIFERNGLIALVDKHMWKCACDILSNWKERGIEQFISINISPKDFYFMDVVSELKKIVEESGIDPVKLRVEITESVMMTDAIDIVKIIGDLREYGFIVEMDDFGSGYSSLNMLKDIPVDVLKIDMQFLRDSERNLKAGYIIKNIIRMSEDLGIDTLTEGVETAAQFERLFDMGCKLYQGYYFSKPLPVDEFEKQWFD